MPSDWIRQSVGVAIAAAGAAAAVHGTAAPPPARDLAGLAGALGRAAGGVVEPGDIRWEPGGSMWRDLALGRRVVFLAAASRGAPKDVFRASVRLAPDGAPIRVDGVRNLTDTPLGDDVGLQVRGTTAAFATVAYGRIQGIGVLELDGVRAQDLPASPLVRVLSAVTAYQHTASPEGIGRTDIVLDAPARGVELALGAEALTLRLDGREREIAYDVRRRTVGGEPAEHGVRPVPRVHAAKPLVLWAVDTVRYEIGPGPIAWLEDKVFGARDTVRRAWHSATASSRETALRQNADAVVAETRATVPLAAPSGSAAAPAEGLRASPAEAPWPPPPIPSLWQEVTPGEGEWRAVTLPFLPPLANEGAGPTPPPYFQRTFIRPDPKRSYSELHLVALDMRQLALGMEAGFEDPEPLTGPPGSGRLPRDPATVERVVATFNGAFKTTHGKYGMMVDRRVLLPPVPGGATVAVAEDGSALFGSWPESTDIPPELVSFRQNLDPLVEDGIANPRGRFVWGWQLAGTSVMTERTALCMTSAGHVYFAWAKEIDGPTLGKGLRQAGCAYAIHLDMNPRHCGFVFTSLAGPGSREAALEKLHPDMGISPDKFVKWSPKDFFYVLLRDPLPKDASGLRWLPDAGAQPGPPWLPGVYAARVTGGGVDAELTSFEPGRVRFVVRAGSAEPTRVGAPPKPTELLPGERGQVVAAVGLGHATESSRAGMSFGAVPALPLTSGFATLVIPSRGAMRVEPPGRALALRADDQAVQLPLLADDGRLVESARDPGALRARGALCVTPGGRLLIARGRHDSSDALVVQLLRAGCRRVVGLDRGSHHPATLHRAGTSSPPLERYEPSVLYVLGQPMIPPVRRLPPTWGTPG